MVKKNLPYDLNIKAFAVRGLVRDLLLNNITDSKYIWSIQKTLNIDFDFNTVMVVMIDNYYSKTYNKSEMQKRNLRMKVLYILESICNKHKALTTNIDEDLFAILFESESYSNVELCNSMKLANHIQDFIYYKSSIPVSIGIGRRYKEVQNLYLSYKEALIACKYKFLLGESQIIHVKDIIPYSKSLELFSAKLEPYIVSKVLGCDKNAVSGIIDDLFEDISSKSINPVFIKIRFIEIVNNIIRISLEAGADKVKLASIDCDAFKKITNSDTIRDLKNQVKKILKNIVDELLKEKQKMNLKVYQKAIEYINKNYEKQITLEDVSNYVYVSPSHFSRGFKEFSGLNFIEYVTKRRIDEAKRLLLTADMNVGEVGQKVGYDDPNYFGRVFKNIVGVPPSKFKVKSLLHKV